jgi:hypothetical protein
MNTIWRELSLPPLLRTACRTGLGSYKLDGPRRDESIWWTIERHGGRPKTTVKLVDGGSHQATAT